MNVVRQIIPPLICGVFAVALYVAINMYNVNANSVTVTGLGEQFFSVIATLYAIITALILVKAIESFEALNSAISHEAMKIRSINAYFSYFSQVQQQPGGCIHRIRHSMAGYIQNVLAQREMFGASSQSVSSSKNDLVIDECIYFCNYIQAEDENDRIALQEIMKNLDEFRTLRAHRINCARDKIPAYLITMLVLMTISIIVPFFLEQKNEIHFNHYVIFTLSTFGSSIFFLLQDINRPYGGLWRVDLNPLIDALKEIRKHL